VALASLGFAAMANSAMAADAIEHTTLALPTITLGFLSQDIATDKGFWKDQGLDVQVRIIQGIGSTNAVISSSVDFALTSGSSLTRATARGLKLVALATLLNQTDEYIVVRKEIAEAAHFDPKAPLSVRAKMLKGLTIAVGGTAALPDTVLKAIQQEAGVPRDDVTTSPMLPGEFVAAFSRKAIDGFVAGPPTPQQAVVDGTGVLITDSAAGEPTKYSPVSAGLLLTRQAFCPEHRSICEKMAHGLVMAAQFIHEHPAEALAVMKAHYGANNSDKVLELSYDAIKSMTPVPPLTTPKMLENSDLLNVAAGFMKQEELLPRYDNIIDNQYTK
jgi:NitT/TauT family transport system substrate-binding protein